MEVAQKKCQVVVKKINLGERAMNRCVVPVRKLRVSDKAEHRMKLPIHLHKLTVLLHNSQRLRKMPVTPREVEHHEGGLSTVQLQKLRILLHKLNLEDCSVSADNRDRKKFQTLRVLLRKLKPDRDRITGVSGRGSSTVGSEADSLLRMEIHSLKVLLKKLKLSKKRESFIVDSGSVSKVQRKELNILLKKVKVNQVQQDQQQQQQQHPVTDRASAAQIASYPDLPSSGRRRFTRVLLKRLKLKREVQECLDHTIFIDDKLGFVVNPYLIPGFHRNRILNRTRVKVLKIGRRSRASRCRVRIRKLQL